MGAHFQTFDGLVVVLGRYGTGPLGVIQMP